MSATKHDFTKIGFARTFVLPALLIFLVPILAYLFFRHAESQYDAEAREAILEQIRRDSSISAEERAKGIAFFSEQPLSQLIADDQLEANIDEQARFDYATFRWMIRLSEFSIIAGVVVLLLTITCVILSLRSQLAQYLSLLASWHVLRIYGALQTVVLGILLVALSYWVTALWFNMFIPKLILVAAVLSLLAILKVVLAIFRRPKNQFVVEGTVLNQNDAVPLWQELGAICDKVGTSLPDRVIAGVDDNFFVTEQPITIEDKKVRGKTLFVSLPLLKQMNAAEADAVLAHEMAHFSGGDTLYSKRISPLLMRYQAYLEGLYEGGISLPVFYFMLCFRAMFELSLSRLSRQREFRADHIAATTTSPRDFAAALLRTMAYSKFRRSVEMELFTQEQAMETADVSRRIERGFSEFAIAFAANPDIGDIETAHPFDSHPPTSQRLSAIGFQLTVTEAQAILATSSDGGWYRKITDADAIEQRQWQAYEKQFRDSHEMSLCYRYLPATPAEQAIVEKAFPPLTFEGKRGTLTLTYEIVRHSDWPDDLSYREITNCEVTDDNVIKIQFCRDKKLNRSIPVKHFKPHQQEVLEAFGCYYSRYVTASDYQQQKRADIKSANS